MTTKKYSQFGTATVLLGAPLLLLFIVLTAINVTSNNTDTPYVFGGLALLMGAILLNFYKLEIIIDESSLSFKLGIGLIKKHYSLHTIKGCKSVTNGIINGLGIRMLSNGVLFNVSGLKAIELSFYNKTTVVRIGSDKPDEIVAELSRRISQDSSDDAMGIRSAGSTLNRILLFASVAVIIVSFSFYGNQDAQLTLNNSSLEIGGMYGCVVPYSEMAKVDTITYLPNVEYKSNGYGLFNVRKGYFVLTNVGTAVLFTNSSSSPVIQLQLKNGEYYFINQSEKSKTIVIFEALKHNIIR